MAITFFINLFSTGTTFAFDAFIGEIRAFPYNFCPRGWQETNGQLLSISQNTALFAVMGTNYGGDGRTTFGLPDLRGRTPINIGNAPGLGNFVQGEKGGSHVASFAGQTIPSHTHTAQTTTRINVSSGDGVTSDPQGNVLADDGRDRVYNAEEPDVSLNESAVVSQTVVANAGNAQSFTRRQPYLGMRFCISVQGLFPARN